MRWSTEYGGYAGIGQGVDDDWLKRVIFLSPSARRAPLYRGAFWFWFLSYNQVAQVNGR